MYSYSQILEGLRNPKKVPQELSRRIGSLKNDIYGIRFLEEDWDNLVILDGCRYDLFAEVNTIDGELEMKRSNASGTPEYLRKNFDKGAFGDVVYASANPHLNHIDSWFYDIIRLWETDWNDEKGTVLPGDATETVLESADKYDDKRLIIHYIQPHRPFLGKTAESLEQSELVANGIVRDEPNIDFWWDRLKRGELSPDTVWRAYRETLEITLPHVNRLVNELSGRTVITADHGNAFGEDRIYGHPMYTNHETLVNVPWHVIESGRKQIIDEEPTVSTQATDNVESRLQALGYIDVN